MYNFDLIPQDSHCLECGETLYGRSDKKFCSPGCRNAWHGHLRSTLRMMRNDTVEGLNHNHKLLDQLARIKKTSCPMDSLYSLGFRPELVTHPIVKRGRHLEYRCFDLTYNLSRAKIFNLKRVE